MILFFILFFLIVLISFFLAYLSMKDFQEKAQDRNPSSSLFLIRNTSSLNPDFLSNLHEIIAKTGLIVSLERLFKGLESALVIFGPKDILLPFGPGLNLLEIEDYCEVTTPITAWEMDIDESIKSNQISSVFSQIPKLYDNEQVWYQMVLKVEKSEEHKFSGQIRIIIVSSDSKRRLELSSALQTDSKPLVKSIKPYSSLQIAQFYKERSIGKTQIKLTGEEIIRLWAFPKS